MTDLLVIAGWCFAASLFLPLFAWALMPLLPRCAATRHLVWLALFAVLLALPVLAQVLPPQILMRETADVAAPSALVAVAAQGWSMAALLPILLLVWFAGVVFCLARLGLGLFGLRRLRAGSVRFDGAADVRLADDGPLAFGCFRPLILLPYDAAQWPRGRLEAVLAHERAHLRRRDSLTQLLAQFTCALYWANPLLWLAARTMRHQAEIAADNAVLAGGIRASDYAAELLQLAGQNLRLPAMAMAAPSLEARVKSVLSTEPSRNGVRAIDAFKIVWLGAAAAVALALVRPAIAQDDDMPPAPPRLGAAPVPSVPPMPPAPPSMRHHHVHITIKGARLTAADRARIRAAAAQARTIMAGERPKVQRAMWQARADRAAALAVQRAMPQVHAAIIQAMAKIPPQAFIDRQIEMQIPLAVHQAVEGANPGSMAPAVPDKEQTQADDPRVRAARGGSPALVMVWLKIRMVVRPAYTVATSI